MPLFEDLQITNVLTIVVAVVYGILIILDIIGRINISKLGGMIFFMLTLPIALVCATLYVANANISSDASTFSLQNLVNTIKVALGIPIALAIFLYPFLSLNRSPCREEEFDNDADVAVCGMRRLIIAGGINVIVYTIFIVCHFLAGTGQSPAEIIMGDILFVAIGYVAFSNGCIRSIHISIEKPNFFGKPRHVGLTKEQRKELAAYIARVVFNTILCIIPLVNIVVGVEALYKHRVAKNTD